MIALPRILLGRYKMVLYASIILSLCGILLAGFSGSPADGGRGGAVAVAVSFFILFLNRGYGARVFEALSDSSAELEADLQKIEGRGAPKTDREVLDQNTHDISAIIKSMTVSQKINSKEVFWQNIYLSAASCIGTLAWGFGDIVSGWLPKLW